jgi:HEAT repeat protein
MKCFTNGYVKIFAMLLGVCMSASICMAQYAADPFGPDDPKPPTATKSIELAEPDAVLLGAEKPSQIEVKDLVRSLGDRSAAVRQAAIRRLFAHPDVAEAGVVRALKEGTLATRLAALELLDEWQAPTEGLDPWQVETISDARLAKLDEWLKQQPARLAKKAEEPSDTPSDKEKLSAERLADAKRQIARMLKSTDEEAAAIRERLAGLAALLLPEVREQLSTAETDRQRHLLLALRYRLIASDALALKWPQGLVRLAASDAKKRSQAAEELAKLATAEDELLLLELFSDADPLVREISLRGLRQLGGEDATAALVRLLKDPEPNVRAAVLKQLAEEWRAGIEKRWEADYASADYEYVAHGMV